MKFLDFVISDIYKHYSDQLAQITIVLPTRRAGAFIRTALGDIAGETPVCSPQCITISDMIDSLCPYAAADELKSICLLFDIYRKKVDANHMTLDAFYGWGKQLITDFNNLDKSFKDVSAQSILSNAMEAHKFDKSPITSDIRERIEFLIKGSSYPNKANNSYRKDFELLWSKLPEIYEELSHKLLLDNCALEGARSKWVVEHFDDIRPKIKDRVFVFAGFNLLLQTERTLMLKLKKQGNALFYWDYDEDFHNKESYINIYHHIIRNIQELGGKTEDTPMPQRMVDIISAQSDNAQARYVSNWLIENHHKGEKTAVVLCNEKMLESVIYCIPPAMSGEINITKGFPLRNTQIYANIISWFNTPSNTTGSTIAQSLNNLIKSLDNKRQTIINKLSKEHTGGLEDFTWYELLATESIYQARNVVVRFKQLVNDGTLSLVNDLNTLKNLILRHLSSINIPFHGEPITDIQIIGMLETRTLDFDNILLLNMEEGVVPRTGNDNSFIPYYLRKYYSLPTNEEQTQIYAYNFFRLLRRANKVTILYSDAQTAEGQKTMSRFVMQILTSKMFACRRKMLSDSYALPSVPTDSQTHNSLRTLSPYNNYMEKLAADNRQSTGNVIASLSPSALNTFLSCKLKFFIKYILNVTEPDNEDNILQMNEIGTLIHNALKAAYDVIGTQDKITPIAIKHFLDNPNNIEEAINTSLQMMNESYRRRKNPNAPDIYTRQQHPIEIAVAKKHVHKVLTNDQKFGTFRIIDNEKDVFYTTNIQGLGEIRIGGSIDRIDAVNSPHGAMLRIIDYKTGHYNKDKMTVSSLEKIFDPHDTKPYVLQTMIYCLACVNDNHFNTLLTTHSITPQLLFTQKDLNNFDPNIYIGQEAVTNFLDYQEPFKNLLQNLVEDLLKETEFPMLTPDNMGNKCKQCAYKQLCNRIE